MTSARPLSAADHEDLLDTDGSPDWDYTPGRKPAILNSKQSDYGRLNGRLVVLDYSTRHMTPPEGLLN